MTDYMIFKELHKLGTFCKLSRTDSSGRLLLYDGTLEQLSKVYKALQDRVQPVYETDLED